MQDINPKIIPLIVFASLVSLFLGWAFLPHPFFALAEKDDLQQICQMENIELLKQIGGEGFKQTLQKCKEYYEQKSRELGQAIAKTEKEKRSIANKIYILQNRIKKLDYEIYQSSLIIEDLSLQIQDTAASIKKSENKIQDLKEKIAKILQLRYEQDKRSLVEIFLTEESFSNFFDDLVALERLDLEVKELLKSIRELKEQLEKQKLAMGAEKKELEHSVLIQRLKKEESDRQKQQQEYFLKLTKEEQQRYLEAQKEMEEKASKIGKMLFELIEVPEGGIPFEKAVEIAKYVSQETGVRPAFSLAVLWQETKIGKVLGGCYLRNQRTGDGVYIKSGKRAPRTMNPSRDISDFLQIIDSLNKAGVLATNWKETPVSCAMILKNGKIYGWGGAMGPAQFIPSTWMLYKEQIEKITGEKPANPWNIKHAFLANGLYLRALGAAKGGVDNEMSAALSYFGCSSWWCRQNYGKPVMGVASCIQQYIDKGRMSSQCRNWIGLK